ncbi:hypothetical protein FFX45_08100 [Thermosynechococcus sp. CL-1]|uniref:hypothetical protein n=1 Tax=unclassified Thermosynechococcus TaxID=2622553 RepID=UPI00122DF608|nr:MULTISPECIES: hypothetical protein [unclassified Thermosynechococcus]QEQ01347.1 hypothetical protein FFX45_08100 [Thermosynechococcus sp. CL-1]WKT82794.1 hypothetical protein QYC28_08120 [Thermosynechococcus sp. HY596]WNC61921.1 hypothetical protein RHK13_08115 [Thermosynechococcus sp. HY591]WNC64475.1 hypothetical protein RHK28_08145 [Thermosynechococcus sp. HY593]
MLIFLARFNTSDPDRMLNFSYHQNSVTARMSNYSDWNASIISYFTQNVPYGTKIYLSLDDDTLGKIGNSFNRDCNHESWVTNFCQAVRDVVVKGEGIDLETVSGLDDWGYPKGVAFLGIMVLAANQMAEDEDSKLDETNYFSRFRQILNLPKDGQPSRPKGLHIKQNEDAPEKVLWETWNRWLLEQGFIPTAKEGSGKQRKYINYPISQSLLRNTDKDRLIRLFTKKQWQTRWDEQTLFAKVASEYSTFTQHLKKLIDDRSRYESVAQAIHETYEDWLAKGSPSTLTGGTKHREWSHQLYTGIYRTEDFLGNIEYYLYPKQQKGRSLGSLTVEVNGERWDLREDRAGWYLPIGQPLLRQEISQGKTYQINPNTQVEKLILPKRDFWILVPDPDNPESGVYASWSSPKLGEQFIILFRESLFTDLQRLRDENLIQWEGDRDTKYLVFGDNSDWYEVYQCQVLSKAWDAVFIQSAELKNELQPKTSLSISFSGGLRVPKKNNTWISDHLPQVTVFAFHPTVAVEITNITTNETVYSDQSFSTNQRHSIPNLTQGSFIVSATCSGQSAQGLIKVVTWDEIDFTSFSA